ncbi:MAG: hypothetical protein AVDCRST_MAG20-2300 [uncultured Acidimicrobiales bacterium]|uniref:Uncharacterized protein n=1 Tax=uncultured Acidimicrobiales bacterium TaxID=310071 RepID=A0A6J4IIL2_9ACTN|nr:MAG: hypothetical protein AVDCRST_MAG20-2300 [uncultured Acidimicrobiales bacterium]
MAEGRNVGSVSAGGRNDTKKKRGLGWLWALLGLLLLAALAFLLIRNAGDDDPEGVGLSGQECPEYAGKEGKDETVEVASDAEPFFGCEVAIVGPVERVLSPDAFLVATEGGDPIVVVRSEDAEGVEVEEGTGYGVEGTIEEQLRIDDLGDVDTAGLEEFEGQPYLSAVATEESDS